MGKPKTEKIANHLGEEEITRSTWEISDGLEVRRVVGAEEEVIAEATKLSDGTFIQPLGTYRARADGKGVLRRTLDDVRGYMITTPGPEGHEVCVCLDKNGHIESIIDRYNTENGNSIEENYDKNGKLNYKKVTEFGEKGAYRIRCYDSEGKQISEECSRNWKETKKDTSKNEKKSPTVVKKGQRQFGNGKGLDDRLDAEQKKTERIAHRVAATRRKHQLG